MKRVLFSLMFCVAVGCGGQKSPSSDANNPPAVKPSVDEATSSIREYFSQPGSGGFSNVQVEQLSEPVLAPPEAMRDAWVYSVTMNCNNVIGEHQQNKNWLVLIGRENGRPTVKDHYHNLERLQQSPLGRDWCSGKGFAEPTVVHEQ